MQMLFDASEEDAAALGPRRDPGHRVDRSELPRPQMQWNQLSLRARRPDVRRAGGAAVDVLRALAARRARRRPTSPRRATTAAGSMPRSAAATCSPPSSTPRSRDRGPGAAGQLRHIAARHPPTMVDLYPAIDLRDGQVVRLRQGDYGGHVYGERPGRRGSFVCRRRRVVGPRRRPRRGAAGSPVNRPVVAAIVAAVAGRANVQTGGGVRTVDDANARRSPASLGS